MVKPGGFLYIETENSLYPYDRHDTRLPLIRLLAPAAQEFLAKRLGRGLDYWEHSFDRAVTLHEYLSYDQLIGAAAALGFEAINNVLPYADMKSKFTALTGGDWLYENIGRYFEAERFLPISVLLKKTIGE